MLIDLATAKLHLRVGDDEDTLVTLYLNAAERSAALFLNRNVYADIAELAAAIAAVPVALASATAAFYAATMAADSLADETERLAAVSFASTVYLEAQASARMVRAGIVVDDVVKAAILLMLGHLYSNRQEVQAGAAVQIPMGVHSLLYPFRVGLGV